MLLMFTSNTDFFPFLSTESTQFLSVYHLKRTDKRLQFAQSHVAFQLVELIKYLELDLPPLFTFT